MNIHDFPFAAIERFEFRRQPEPLSADLRPVYRVTLLLLVLRLNCHSNTASLLKLQFFNWLLKSSSLQRAIEQKIADAHSVFTLTFIHMDPMVNLALKYAIADGLVSATKNAKYRLTKKGYQFTDRILQGADQLELFARRAPFLVEQKDLLTRIGQKVTELRLRRLLL